MTEGRDESFSHLHRLRKSSDFHRVFSRGKRTATSYFVIYTLPNPAGESRLGIQVKAKIGNAVRRNYVKRIVREVFRRLKGKFRVNIDCIFIAEKGILDLNYHSFALEFQKALKRYLP